MNATTATPTTTATTPELFTSIAKTHRDASNACHYHGADACTWDAVLDQKIHELYAGACADGADALARRLGMILGASNRSTDPFDTATHAAHQEAARRVLRIMKTHINLIALTDHMTG